MALSEFVLVRAQDNGTIASAWSYFGGPLAHRRLPLVSVVKRIERAQRPVYQSVPQTDAEIVAFYTMDANNNLVRNP